jgi:hypothetical protein
MNRFTHPAVILRLVIAVAYILLGIMVLVAKFSKILLTPATKIPFALLLIAYGLFRVYRACRLTKIEDEED